METNATPETTHYVEGGYVAPSISTGRETTTPAAMTPGEQTLSELLGRDPDSMPEVLRELTMLAGAVDGVHRCAEEVRDRLAHVLGLDEPTDPAQVPPPHAPPVDSALGQKVRATYEQVAQIERVLGNVLRRLTV